MFTLAMLAIAVILGIFGVSEGPLTIGKSFAFLGCFIFGYLFVVSLTMKSIVSLAKEPKSK